MRDMLRTFSAITSGVSSAEVFNDKAVANAEGIMRPSPLL